MIDTSATPLLEQGPDAKTNPDPEEPTPRITIEGLQGVQLPPELGKLLVSGLLSRIAGEGRAKARVESAFSALREITPDSDIGKELLKYDETINARMKEAGSLDIMNPDLAILALTNIGRTKLEEGFSRILERLKSETTYLKELDDVGIAENIDTGIHKGVYGAKVIFSNRASRLAKFFMRNPGAAGTYSPMFDTVFIEGGVPDTRSMWMGLIGEGTLPGIIATLDHELAHDTQTSAKQRVMLWGASAGHFATIYAASHLPFLTNVATVMWSFPLFRGIRGLIGNERILGEVHAFEAAASSPTNSKFELDEKEEIIDILLDRYGCDRDHIPQISKAFDLVHSLRAFGCDDKEIGSLVSGSKYNKKTETYPRLEARVQEFREQEGLTDKREFELVRDAMFAKQEVEIRVLRRKAQEIASDELMRLHREELLSLDIPPLFRALFEHGPRNLPDFHDLEGEARGHS